MYIIEIIVKFIQKRKEKKIISDDFNRNEEDCKHVYMAIDSEKTYLACYKCGDVIKNNGEIKINKNPFTL